MAAICFIDAIVQVPTLGSQTVISTRIPFFSIKHQIKNCPTNQPFEKTSDLLGNISALTWPEFTKWSTN